MRELIIADNVHGESGLTARHYRNRRSHRKTVRRWSCGENAARKCGTCHDCFYRAATNVALLLNSHPELHSKIARI